LPLASTSDVDTDGALLSDEIVGIHKCVKKFKNFAPLNILNIILKFNSENVLPNVQDPLIILLTN
jgi:hypothetical protein